ncbi:MAG: ribosome-binding factor A [Candidatus Doudnabacteria bacterium RIFCSPHIGHO2_01_52_17]|uniref:Ribosome-binding factor A n=1 Tax=Candidatus Doudnabacteria bacterium RIFCSPHIGHO2_01_52_17 TaxID=1817820 RepID=A0A1F5NB20_9BACT|nr:MAG: Ribosome-binding factor A [Parcubacteria group bacterium GW2011_GWA2_52_8]OGE74839.1 MAG: ribosome-binding factor A [Candidatus Doudnabacteria bacterium RIFCSPHIGHO2_01_52_17]
MTVRQDKVNSLLQREISAFLVESKPDGISGLVTILGVDTSPDLESAKVFFSVVGQEFEEVAEILRKNIYEIQGELLRKLIMRKVPRITFIPDHSGEYARHISDLIAKLHKNDPSPRSEE